MSAWAYQAVFENVAIGIAFVDPSGKPLHANPALCRMLGYSEGELQGMAFPEFTYPDDTEKDLELYRGLVAGDMDSYAIEKRYVRKDGRIIWAHLTVSAHRDAKGKLIHAIGTVEDITGLRRSNEELARSNRDLEHFAYVASHDLKTPLRKVKGFTMLLQEELKEVLPELEEDQRARVQQYMQFVVDGADKSEKLIDGLLAFSRTGRKMDVVEVDLDDALDDALFILSEDLREKEVIVQRCPLPRVWADASLMTRIFQNLIGNAIKFRQEGLTPSVLIEAHDHDTHWEVVVTDNGIGLDARHQDRVFLIFQRIGNKKRGMGLGLALCKRIVDRHGGRIWFESGGSGGGTAFHFTLPKEPHHEQRSLSSSPPSGGRALGGG